MGKGGSKVEVTDYNMSMHYGICNGPLDALRRVVVKEKDAWDGTVTDLSSFAISMPELFGGNKKEGGVGGVITYLPGAEDQVLPDWLAVKLGRPSGADCPGYRGLASVFFTGAAGATDAVGSTGKNGAYQASSSGFYWTSNNPYLPGVWVTVQRAPIGLTASLAMITADAVSQTGATAWRFLPITLADSTNRSAVDFDDSNWLIGTAPFGNDDAPDLGGDTPASVTYLAPDTAAWLRCHADSTVTSITFSCDDEADLYYNGVQVGSTYTIGTHTVALTPAGGDNVIAVRLADTAGDKIYWTDDLPHVAAAIAGPNANPAHIIYECLTNTDWGMGSPAAAIDVDSFEAAAQALYDEHFGLSMLWTRQAKIEAFVQEVLDHIQAVVFVDPSTGLLTLNLIRGDYDPDALPELTPYNADLTNFGRKLWGEIVNEIVVTWTNPQNEQDETITCQDLASIATQGGIISDSRNYYGVRNADLAQSLGWRDLRSAGQPLATCAAEVDRTLWRLRPASVVKVTWPEYGLEQIVMRVTSIDYGKPGDMAIKLDLIEDVYGLDIGQYESPPSSEWIDTSAAPQPVETVEIFTLPLFMAVQSPVAAFVDGPEYPEVVAGVLATTSATDTSAAELWDEVTLANGSAEWTKLANLSIIGRGELVASLDAEASSTAVTIGTLTGSTIPIVGGFVIIGADGETGNEIAMVDAADYGTGEYTLTRGVLDTVPRAWPAAAVVRFVDSSTLFEDSVVRSSGETVDYKIRSRTSLGLLPLASASLESATLTDRPWQPNRPAKVEAYGEAWSSAAAPIDATLRSNPWVTVTWANRNRLLEDSQVLGWTDADVTPETGQTTTIEVRDGVGGALVTTHNGLTGASFDVPDASFGGSQIIELRTLAKRSDDDGDFESLQYFSHWLLVSGASRRTEAEDPRIDEGGIGRLTED